MAQPDARTGEAERIRERIARLDTERAELEQRLAELAGARLPVPEIARHRGQIANRSPTREKIRTLPLPLRRPGGCVSQAMGKCRKEDGRLRAGLRQRVAARGVPQAPGAVRGLSQPSVRADHR